MGVKLVNDDDGSVPAITMTRGQLAVIVEHPQSEHIGRVVQRSGNDLRAVGGEARWNGYFENVCRDSMARFDVRILLPGERIEVT